MAGVGIVPESVENEDVEISQQRQALGRDVAHVGEVGGAAEAVAGDLLAAVGYGDATKTGVKEVEARSGRQIDAMDFHLCAGGITVFLAKGVLEDALEVPCRFIVGVDR